MTRAKEMRDLPLGLDVDSSGNVGIGMTPVALTGNHFVNSLSIGSNGPYILLKDENNANKMRYIANNTGEFQMGQVNDDGSTNKTEHLRITSDGKLGVGATTPQCKINIFGESTSNWADSDSMYGKDHPAFLKITNGQETVGVESGIVMRSKSTGAGVWSMYAKQTANYLADLHFRGRNAGTTSAVRLTLKSDGKVGIGTTSPDSLLTVYSTGATTAKIDTASSSSFAELIIEDGNAGYAFQTRSDNAQSTGTGSFLLNDRDSSSFPIVIKEGNATNTLVLSSSKVGIGTASPSFTFHSVGTARLQGSMNNTHGQLSIYGTSAGDAQIAFLTDANGRGIYVDNNDTNKMKFYTGWGKGVSYKEIVMDNDANLICGGGQKEGRGITLYGSGGNGFYSVSTGTSFYCITNHQLTSSTGTISTFYNNGTYCGGITINSTNNTLYQSASDYRLKENVVPMTGATERLKQLNPVTFDWINSGESSEGFLAHEVGAIVPISTSGTKDEVYDEAGADDNPNVNVGDPKYQSVDPAKLVPLLVKTIQELEARITQLESA